MSTVPPTEYVEAERLRPGDKLIYAGLVVEVAARPVTADWREAGEHVYGVEIECKDVSGTARLFLYRPRHHLMERMVRDA